MDSTPTETEKKLGKDLETFEALPVKTQELESLQDQAEKSTGAKKVALHKEIQHKSDQPTTLLT